MKRKFYYFLNLQLKNADKDAKPICFTSASVGLVFGTFDLVDDYLCKHRALISSNDTHVIISSGIISEETEL
ncbi:hypothetical protein [Parabacteroides bouchesdurhonensis]|uniref:hypothetical protein n=1 Tax=Parabacteroides bouchesdurhonensis TaxID=1936995 RepID=UPI0022E0D5F2|nr:hypothetical protein [Parabacteroides bouchesdurhonensis]